MKRKWLAMLLVFCMVATVAFVSGCGAGGSGEENGDNGAGDNGGNGTQALILGTWEGTVTVTFDDQTTFTGRISYMFDSGSDPASPTAVVALDNEGYYPVESWSLSQDNVLTVTTRPVPMSSDDCDQYPLTSRYQASDTSLTHLSSSGSVCFGDGQGGHAALRQISSVSGTITKTSSQSIHDYRYLEGRVYDQSSQDPVQGAVVATSLDGATAETDENGHFFLLTGSLVGGGTGVYTITITMQGNLQYSGTGNWGDHPTGQEFHLPGGGSSVTGDDTKVYIDGHVYAEGTTTPVSGAVVGTSLDGETATTDGNGHFFLQTNTPANYCCTPYTITITAQGYQLFSGTWVWGDHPTNQVFYLVP